MCPLDVIFSANDSVFRAEHAPLLRRASFLSKTRVLRVLQKVQKVQRVSAKSVPPSKYKLGNSRAIIDGIAHLAAVHLGEVYNVGRVELREALREQA